MHARKSSPNTRGRCLDRGLILSASMERALTHPGLLHGSLVVAACQWAWVTGSLDDVKIPFLHHKAAAYQFARQQILDPETAFTDTTVFAIAALALVEVRRLQKTLVHKPIPVIADG